eukprot:scaffold3667_cov63-Cyclotella_meneghiniana.AAC.3
MLHVLDSATTGHAATQASHEKGTLLMNPGLLFILDVRIATVEVIRFSNYPVDRGLTASLAAALAGGLSDYELFGFSETIDGHGVGYQFLAFEDSVLTVWVLAPAAPPESLLDFCPSDLIEDFLHRNKYLSFRILPSFSPSADDDVRQMLTDIQLATCAIKLCQRSKPTGLSLSLAR